MTIAWRLILLSAVVVGGCATQSGQTGEKDMVTRAVEQPFRDLSLMRDKPVDALTSAAAAPYGPPDPLPCEKIVREIQALDEALGPDIDAPQGKTKSAAQSLAEDAVADALSLPFRGIVRTLSGAARREREARRAVLAGMVRRGFLKGLARGSACTD